MGELIKNMQHDEEFNFEDDSVEIKKLEESHISWYKKLLIKFWPKMAFRVFAKEMGISNPVFDKASEVFGRAERIDIHPLSGPSRGFVIILDLKTALFFYQDGDHFVYDGFEIGEYEKGDVTIFDKISSV